MKPSDIGQWQNVIWGVAIILLGLGTYAAALLDGDPSTLPDANLLVTQILLGISKFGSATSAEVKKVEGEVKDVKTDVRMVASDVTDVRSRSGFPPSSNG